MDITITKITPSKNNKDLIFVDLTLNEHGLKIKGIKARKRGEDIFIHLPSLELENSASEGPHKRFYSPVTFLSRDRHEEFIHSVREKVEALFGGDKK